LMPGSLTFLALWMGLTYLSLIPAGLLCLATSWGLKRGYRWSRWTGIVVSGMLLWGFPWLTVLGAIGLYALLKAPEQFGPAVRPMAPKKSKDRWHMQPASAAQQVVSTILFFVAMAGFALFAKYAPSHGMKPWDSVLRWLV